MLFICRCSLSRPHTKNDDAGSQSLIFKGWRTYVATFDVDQHVALTSPYVSDDDSFITDKQNSTWKCPPIGTVSLNLLFCLLESAFNAYPQLQTG